MEWMPNPYKFYRSHSISFNMKHYELHAIKLARLVPHVHLELSQKCKMEPFPKKVNDWKLLTIFTKSSTLDASLGFGHGSTHTQKN